MTEEPEQAGFELAAIEIDGVTFAETVGSVSLFPVLNEVAQLPMSVRVTEVIVMSCVLFAEVRGPVEKLAFPLLFAMTPVAV